jgi:hypothetical protein
MNIFYLHVSPIISATFLCDKHINKMLVESVQMLSTAHHLTGTGNDQMYKPAYQNHPCTKWARESYANYHWLWMHAEQIASEFLNRFGKFHASAKVLHELPDPVNLPHIDITPPAQAMPDQYKHDDAWRAYRAYYKGEKASIAKWEKGREAPYWW